MRPRYTSTAAMLMQMWLLLSSLPSLPCAVGPLIITTLRPLVP